MYVRNDSTEYSLLSVEGREVHVILNKLNASMLIEIG